MKIIRYRFFPLRAKPRRGVISYSQGGLRAFSLIETILAVGVVACVLLPILGLLSISLSTVNSSRMKMSAANVASEILHNRISAPTNNIAGSPVALLIVGTGNLTATPSPTNSVVGPDGSTILASGQPALFRVVSSAWVDQASSADTNSKVVRIRLLLSWPPNVTTPATGNQYFVMTSTVLTQ